MTEEEYYDIYRLVDTIEDMSWYLARFDEHQERLGNREDYKKLLKVQELVNTAYKSLINDLKKNEGKF